MSKKMLIGAGIVLAVFVLFLILLGGGSGTDKIVTKEELDVTFTTLTCEVKDENSVDYNVSLFTNDITFDGDIQQKNYTQVKINQEKEIASLGVAFMVKSNYDVTLYISLEKNGVELKTTSVTIEGGNTGSVNLILDEAVAISATDDFSIKFSQTTEYSFAFDNVIFFLDEV